MSLKITNNSLTSMPVLGKKIISQCFRVNDQLRGWVKNDVVDLNNLGEPDILDKLNKEIKILSKKVNQTCAG